MRESEPQSRAVPHRHPDSPANSDGHADPPVSFPLAVVTGITNLKATITLDELGTLASGGQLVVPCGVTVNQPTLTATAPCVAADQIAADLHTDPDARGTPAAGPRRAGNEGPLDRGLRAVRALRA